MLAKIHIASCLLAGLLVSCGKETEKAKSSASATTTPKKCASALALDRVAPQTYAEMLASSYDPGAAAGDETGFIVTPLGNGDARIPPLLAGGAIHADTAPYYEFLASGRAPRVVNLANEAKVTATGASVVQATVNVSGNVATVKTAASWQGAADAAVSAFQALVGANRAKLDAAFDTEKSALQTSTQGRELTLFTIQPQPSGAPSFAFLYVHVAGARRSGPNLATTNGDDAGLDLGAPAAIEPLLQGVGVEFAAVFKAGALGTTVDGTPISTYQPRALPRVGEFPGTGNPDPLAPTTTTTAPGTPTTQAPGNGTGTKPASGSTATGGCE